MNCLKNGYLGRRLLSTITKNFENLEVVKKEHVVQVSFNRPSVANALGIQMAKEFEIFMEEIEKQQDQVDIRCIIVTGKGKSFCTGRDLKESKTHSKTQADQYQKFVMECNTRWQKLSIPTIAAINGHCFGWGMELSLVCDIRLTWNEAIFCLPECGLAIFPGAGGAVTLPRIINLGLAKELIYTSKRFSGKEAKDYGIVNHSYDSIETLHEKAMEMAKKISSNGPLGVKSAKKVIDNSLDLSMEEGITLSNKHRLPLNYTNDFKEALQAFQEKRKPTFRGN